MALGVSLSLTVEKEILDPQSHCIPKQTWRMGRIGGLTCAEL